MNDKQKIKKKYEVSSSESSWGDYKKLIDLWLGAGVSDTYQTIVLDHIQHLPDPQLQKQTIAKEIELTQKRESKYFVIAGMLAERAKMYEQFKADLQRLHHQFTDELRESEVDLEELTDSMSQLRKIQMLISESIFELFREYSSGREPRGQEYISVFQQFDCDWHILKSTFLKYYIPLSEEFDPFLLEPAKYIKTMYQKETLIYDQHVEALFSVNPSYMFRLLRAKKNIVALSLKSKRGEKEGAKGPVFNKNLREKEPHVKKIPSDNEAKVERVPSEAPKTRVEGRSMLNNRIYLQSIQMRKPKQPTVSSNESSLDEKAKLFSEFKVAQPIFTSQQANMNVLAESPKKRRFLTQTPDLSQSKRNKVRESTQQPSKKHLHYFSSIIKIDIANGSSQKKKSCSIVKGNELNFQTQLCKKSEVVIGKGASQLAGGLGEVLNNEGSSPVPSNQRLNKNIGNFRSNTRKKSKQSRKRAKYEWESDITLKKDCDVGASRYQEQPVRKVRSKRAVEADLQEKRKNVVKTIEEKYRLLAEKETEEELLKLVSRDGSKAVGKERLKKQAEPSYPKQGGKSAKPPK